MGIVRRSHRRLGGGQFDEDETPTIVHAAAGVLVATLVLAVWTVMAPVPYVLCVILLAALPLVAITMAARSGGALKLVNEAGEITTYTFMIILLSSVMLAYRSTDIHGLTWTTPLVGALCVATAFVALLAWIDRPNLHKRMLITTWIVALAWGWGCTTFANSLLDVSPKQVFRPQIAAYTDQAPHAPRGGGGYVRHLVVAPWGPVTRIDNPVVPEALFRRAEAGEPICVAMGHGALGAQWYFFVVCNGANDHPTASF